MRLTKKYLFYLLAFGSAIISAINSGIDATVSTVFITDVWALGLAIFLVGIPVSIGFALVFSIPLRGKSLGSRIVDPSFSRIRFLRKDELWFQLIAAFGNALYTIGYFALFTILGDPSIVLPFTQAVILYLVAIESINEKDVPTLSEIQSILIVTFGAVLGSISLSGSLNLQSLLIVFFVINPGWVLVTIYQRKLKRLRINVEYNDAVNIRLWNVIFASMISVGIIFLLDTILGTAHLQAGLSAIIEQFHWATIIAMGAFFAFIFYIRALGIGKASIVQAIRSSIIVFSIPVSLILTSMGIIDPFSLDPVLLVIKSIGIIIMMLGIISFALNLIQAYIFIKAKPGFKLEETMNTLWRINGVTSVSVVAGPYDYIVKIRTRTLFKGYEKIIKKIEDIDAIQFYKWESILKEWEEI